MYTPSAGASQHNSQTIFHRGLDTCAASATLRVPDCNRRGSKPRWGERPLAHGGCPSFLMRGENVPAYERWDLSNLPESNLEFLVKPYIVKRSLTLIVGEGGASKSWLLLDLAIAGALEQCWMGQQCVKFSSLIFDEDGSEIETVRRYKRLCAARLVAHDDPRLKESFSMIPAQGLKLDDKLQVQRVQDTIEAYKPDLVGLDALVAIHGREENSNNEMKFVMRDRIRALMRITGVTVPLVHHLGKSGEVSGIGQIRGATEIVNASDAALLAKSEDGEIGRAHV